MARREDSLDQALTSVERNQEALRARLNDPIRALQRRQDSINRQDAVDKRAAPEPVRDRHGRFTGVQAGEFRSSEDHEGNWVIDYTPSVGVPRRTVRAAYDAERQALRVVFARGPASKVTWEYQNVNEAMALDFTRQASPGRWINSSGINGHPHANRYFDKNHPDLEVPM